MFIYYRFFFTVYLLVSVLVLGTAYVLERYFSIEPCKLCLYERVPYMLMMIVAFIGLFLPKYKNSTCIVILLISLSSVLLAFFHVGVEHSWIDYDSTCVSDGLTHFNSLEEFKKQIKAQDINSCKVANYTFLKLSLATWNLVVSLGILVFAFLGTKSLKEKRHGAKA